MSAKGVSLLKFVGTVSLGLLTVRSRSPSSYLRDNLNLPGKSKKT